MDNKPKRSGFEPLPQSTKPCRDAEHFPPTHICIPSDQQYRHICPSCGYECILRSPQVTLLDQLTHWANQIPEAGPIRALLASRR